MNRALRTSFIAAAAAAALGLTACGGPSADPSPTVLATQVAPEGPTATTPAPAVGETEEGTAGETGGETGEGTTGETGEGTAEATTGTATPTTDPASPGAAGTTPPSTPTPAAPATPAPAPTATATPTSAGEATGHERELLDAIALAEEAVPGTRAIDLDREDDGAKYEIEVTDGTTLTKVEVEGGAARVEESEPLEADERAEFEAAVITIQEAIRKALDTWPGIVDDIELDEDGDLNAVVWEFTIHQDGREIEVWVDAATGEPGE